MTIPAQDLTVGKPIAARLALVMCFPSTTTLPASIGKNKLLVTPYIGMIVSLSSALAMSPSSIPRLLDCTIGESHLCASFLA